MASDVSDGKRLSQKAGNGLSVSVAVGIQALLLPNTTFAASPTFSFDRGPVGPRSVRRIRLLSNLLRASKTDSSDKYRVSRLHTYVPSISGARTKTTGNRRR